MKDIPVWVFVLATGAGLLSSVVTALALYRLGLLSSKAGRRAAYVVNIGAFCGSYVLTIWFAAGGGR